MKAINIKWEENTSSDLPKEIEIPENILDDEILFCLDEIFNYIKKQKGYPCSEFSVILYYCEDGHDNWIEIFDKEEDALKYAEKHENVLEIHNYEHIFKDNEDDTIDINHIGCIWMRNGWNGFEFSEE